LNDVQSKDNKKQTLDLATDLRGTPMADNNTATTSQETEIPPNAENHYIVGKADLPLHCPMEGMSLWNSHPRVFLPIEETGKAKCPYCGAEYELKTD
jgi:uncharacterized Zn-finger protein